MVEWFTSHLPVLSLSVALISLGMLWHEVLTRWAPADEDEEVRAGRAMLTDAGYTDLFGLPARPYDYERDGA